MIFSARVEIAAAMLRLGLGIGVASAQVSQPHARPLGPIVATASIPISFVYGFRALSNGNVLVNDGGNRQITLLDSALRPIAVTLDTSSSAARQYPRSFGTTIAYAADSTLFVDLSATALLVLDPSGRFVRAIAPPRPKDAGMLSIGNVAVDARSRLIYIAYRQVPIRPDSSHKGVPPRDSVPLIAASLIDGRVDTITFVETAASYPFGTYVDSVFGERRVETINPLPFEDGWALLPDGTVAVVRARTLRIDWFGTDGTRSTSAPLPHDWVRLDDAAKIAITDSIRRYNIEHPMMWASQRDASGTVVRRALVPAVPLPDDMPDYPAPFVRGVAVDGAGNLWIPDPGKVTYSVVDRRGTMIDRVAIPGGTSIVGFGPGVVYLTSRTGSGASLVRARIR